jgi:hypothetical protein
MQKTVRFQKRALGSDGGIIHPRTIEKLDNKGEGIPNSIIIAHKRMYPIDSVIEWLRTKSRVICKK